MYTESSSSATESSFDHFRNCRPMTASTFEVESEISVAGALVQIQRYRWDEPISDGYFVPSACYLDLALIRRSPAEQASMRQGGRYSAYSPIGDSVFWPAGSEIRSHIPAVDHRVLSCIFEPQKLQQYLDLQWSAQEVSACFDIRNPTIRHGLARLAEEVRSPGFASEFLVQSTVGALVVELARHFRGVKISASENGSRLSTRQLRLLEELVESVSGTTPSHDELARTCGRSEERRV